MNRQEAKAIAEFAASSFRNMSWVQLKDYIGKNLASEATGPSGHQYQIEIEVFWDNKPGETIRVTTAISDSFWTSIFPYVGNVILKERT